MTYLDEFVANLCFMQGANSTVSQSKMLHILDI